MSRYLIIALLLIAPLAACSSAGPAERLGKSIDQLSKDVSDISDQLQDDEDEQEAQRRAEEQRRRQEEAEDAGYQGGFGRDRYDDPNRY